MTNSSQTNFNIVIPSRLGSTRLAEKPLRKIAGKSMIEWVYRNAQKSGADQIIVATDHEKIVREVTSFGGTAMLTDLSHRSGTDRIAEVATRENWSEDTLVVNLQGDEPGVKADLIEQVATLLKDNSWAGIATVATPIQHKDDLFNPNVVKAVLDHSGKALYFSRAPIPWVRDAFKDIESQGELPQDVVFLRHIGLYAYRVGSLQAISEASPSNIESAESLEQLWAMSMGINICVTTVNEPPGHGVDTEEDLERAAAYLERESS